jgi:hypothetical protein
MTGLWEKMVEGYNISAKLPSVPRCAVMAQTKLPLMVSALSTDT